MITLRAIFICTTSNFPNLPSILLEIQSSVRMVFGKLRNCQNKIVGCQEIEYKWMEICVLKQLMSSEFFIKMWFIYGANAWNG